LLFSIWDVFAGATAPLQLGGVVDDSGNQALGALQGPTKTALIPPSHSRRIAKSTDSVA
jgi:hypothetical protein